MGRSTGTGRTRSAGFTLIELLVVVAIIGILAGVVVGQYGRSIVKSKEAVLKENLFTVRNVINQYFADKGKYPSDLHALVDDHYLRAMPIDPFTKSSDTWNLVYSESDDQDDITMEPGIVDLHSGSEKSALDGTPYSEW
jgi:general secretion pathway protein G